MTIRPCTAADLAAMAELFYQAVHTTCAAHYSPAQLDAWAPREEGTAGGQTSSARRPSWPRRRTVPCWASAPWKEIIWTCSTSGRTARAGAWAACCATFWSGGAPGRPSRSTPPGRPWAFFEHRGYRLVRAQTVERRGETLENFVMEKELI